MALEKAMDLGVVVINQVAQVMVVMEEVRVSLGAVPMDP